MATAVVSWISLGLGLWVITHDRYYRRFQLRVGKPDWKSLKELLRLGIPMGGSYLVEVSAFTFMALLVAREGTLVTGGHQIMSNGRAVLHDADGAGRGHGGADGTGHRRRQAGAHRIGMAGLTLGLMGALLTAAVLLIGRPLILAAYTDKAEVAAVAATLLAVLPLFHLFDSMQCINSYLLRAYKIAVVPLLLQTVALAGVGRWAVGGSASAPARADWTGCA